MQSGICNLYIWRTFTMPCYLVLNYAIYMLSRHDLDRFRAWHKTSMGCMDSEPSDFDIHRFLRIYGFHGIIDRNLGLEALISMNTCLISINTATNGMLFGGAGLVLLDHCHVSAFLFAFLYMCCCFVTFFFFGCR